MPCEKENKKTSYGAVGRERGEGEGRGEGGVK